MPQPSETTTSAAVAAALRAAREDPAGLDDAQYAALLGAAGEDLDSLAALADAVRREAVGDTLTYVVNRNLDTGVVGAGTAQAQELTVALVREAVALGATEVCLQGPLPAGAPADGYLDLVRLIASAAPDLHLHAFRPAEVADAAARRGSIPREFLAAAREAGLDSVPGTAARILDDGVRTLLNGGPDLPAARWLELVATAHEVGLTSTATMVYGSVETPAQQVAHLRTLAALQDRTGGFTEFIPMPFVAGVNGVLPPEPRPAGSRRGPDARESRAVHAVARLLLHGRIDHVQAAWTKLGLDLTAQVLAGGADDAGGLLLDGTLLPSAGAEAGRVLAVADVERLAAGLGRSVRQRTTAYGDVAPQRPAVGA
ncbi:FO synthase [Kineococcus rubinsiae]|uniref:FO synthase n=1 Tax=Kineococcus rubinsiae TaxID=2609562 RepID=UPI0027E4D1FE|nr:FO synthase [Kineococcus rubinsiae]